MNLFEKLAPLFVLPLAACITVEPATAPASGTTSSSTSPTGTSSTTSASTSTTTTSSGVVTIEEYSLNRCDPQLPPDPVDPGNSFPLPVYYSEDQSGPNFTAELSWYPPLAAGKTFNLKDGTNVDWLPEEKNSVTFRWSTTENRFFATFVGQTAPPEVPDYPYLGTFNSDPRYALTKPTMAIVPSSAAGRLRVLITVTYRGLTTSFALEDAS